MTRIRAIGVVAATSLLVALTGVAPAAAAAAGGLGISTFTMETTNANGEPYVYAQAGGHPYALTTTLEFDSEKLGGRGIPVPVQDPKDVAVYLPPGLLGDPMATPRCPITTFTESNAKCPASTQVGTVELRWGGNTFRDPVYNLTPETGQSAEFGIASSTGIHFIMTAHVVRVRTNEGERYGLTVIDNGIPTVGLTYVRVTFWGVPAAPSHDAQRGETCDLFGCKGGGHASGDPLIPFLTLPADCAAGPFAARVLADSWQKAGLYVEGPVATLPAATGCNALSFNPTIALEPDTTQAEAPVGAGITLTVPQIETPEEDATPQLRDAVVTLPEGMSINPSVVDGVAACDESGPEGINFSGPESEQLGPDGEEQLAPGHCPNASTLGTAEAITPLLPNPVKGHVYLARPSCGASGQPACTEADAVNGGLYKLYLELGGTGALADAGVNIKVAGTVSASLATGQLTTTFAQNPQLPFSELKVHLNGGPRAPLANPQSCGEARTTAQLTPWSSPFTPDATPFSFFQVGGCQATQSFTPGFVAGATSARAAAFSPFALTLSRRDGEQYLSGVQIHTPPGLLGVLASVPLCGEPQAARGECSSASRIGSTMVASGAGSHPFWIEGTVYLTGPYKGAPFGLSIVTDVQAGPFNLGNVVVRAAIDIDPSSAALTVTTDPLPQLVYGVPLRLQQIRVLIDRPSFMLNPTDCSALKIAATVSAMRGAAAAVSSPFAAGDCGRLAFKPMFKVSTSGRTSRANGASLDAKVSYPKGAMGNDANISYVKVSLPRQLPSRLTTLQQACPAATFEANPAACPKPSVVGIARTSTPLLPVQLSGPVYFVSHGGEAFPNLIVVLQGDGVRVDLVGDTFINKSGITSSTFKTVPDVPVNSFELYLPQGKFSALAANGNLCKATHTMTVKRRIAKRVRGRTVHRTVKVRKRMPGLTMPTEFIAQNGRVIKQNTRITVTGCPGSKKAKKAQAASRPRHDSGRSR